MRWSTFPTDASAPLPENGLADTHPQVVKRFEDALSEIARETDLVEKDRLARGALVRRASAWIDTGLHLSETPEMIDRVGPNDPIEYWGASTLRWHWHYFTDAAWYPWMRLQVGRQDEERYIWF
jgi:hypothetical protein